MGWLRDIVDIAKDPEVRLVVREVVHAIRLGREVERRRRDGIVESDMVSLDAKLEIDRLKAVAQAKRDELKARLDEVLR